MSHLATHTHGLASSLLYTWYSCEKERLSDTSDTMHGISVGEYHTFLLEVFGGSNKKMASKYAYTFVAANQEAAEGGEGQNEKTQLRRFEFVDAIVRCAWRRASTASRTRPWRIASATSSATSCIIACLGRRWWTLVVEVRI